LERDNSILPRRLKDAKEAVMDRITGSSVDSASLSERKLLLAALNTISELQRLVDLDGVRPSGVTQVFGHAA
jgi:hypothetical protein